jgi:uncharacterized heparinase superfamily protein
MVFNATFNSILAISWRSVVLIAETGEPGEYDRPAASHSQTLSHNVVSSTPHNVSGDMHCKSNYHATTTTSRIEEK